MRTAPDSIKDFEQAYGRWSQGHFKLLNDKNNKTQAVRGGVIPQNAFRFIYIKRIQTDLQEPLDIMRVAIGNYHQATKHAIDEQKTTDTLRALQLRLIGSALYANLELTYELNDLQKIFQGLRFELTRDDNACTPKSLVNQALGGMVKLTCEFKKAIPGLFGSTDYTQMEHDKTQFNSALGKYKEGFRRIIGTLDTIEIEDELLTDSLKDVLNQFDQMYVQMTGANKTLAETITPITRHYLNKEHVILFSEQRKIKERRDTIRFFGREVEGLEPMPLTRVRENAFN